MNSNDQTLVVQFVEDNIDLMRALHQNNICAMGTHTQQAQPADLRREIPDESEEIQRLRFQIRTWLEQL